VVSNPCVDSGKYDGANLAFIISLAVGVIATCIIVEMGNVKEAYWDRDRQASRAAIAEANARAAEAEKETARCVSQSQATAPKTGTCHTRLSAS
jgi:hypothetical protein